MNYEKFHKAALLNREFEVIPTKVKLLSEGIVLDEHGYLNYDGKTYIPNMTKLADLPRKIQYLFLDGKKVMTTPAQNDDATDDNILPTVPKKDSNLEGLNKILFEQLQNIINPEKGMDLDKEMKKANTVVNIADKILTIADLSLKAELLCERQRARKRHRGI